MCITPSVHMRKMQAGHIMSTKEAHYQYERQCAAQTRRIILQLKVCNRNQAHQHTIVPQLNKCLKCMAFRGAILYRIQSFRLDLNFRHLCTGG